MNGAANQITRHNFFSELSSKLDSWKNHSQEERTIILQSILVSLELQNYPFFESESKVVLVYHGEANNVTLLSDITGWTDQINFKKLFNTDLFYLEIQLENDARIQYQLIVDGNAICDPSNKYKCLHGLGEMSELAMPKYERHPYLEDFLFGREGNFEGLVKHILPAGVLPYEHEVYVLLPPDFNRGNNYPTVYFHDGPDYIRFGLAQYSINKLIKEELIKPCIAIFVTPPNLHQPVVPNRSTEYGMSDDYVKFFCEELVYFIDQNYPTARSAESRFVIGDSFAGLISFYIAFSRSDVFTSAYSQSGYFSFSKDRMINLLNYADRKPLKLYLDIGTYEYKVGADFLPATELDFTNANRRMRDVLTKKGYKFIYKEYHEGHTWGNWRRHLIDGLIYFFGNKGELK